MDKNEINERIKKGWIRAALIIEVLGKPADYVEKSLSLAVDALEKDKKAERKENSSSATSQGHAKCFFYFCRD